MFSLGRESVSEYTITYSWPFDSKHLPEDPKALQQMVLDLMAQLDREFH